jgi:YegS/Rv2252/BmrU family lipid kinase
MVAYKNIHFVINPAAGQPEPVLHIINKVIYPHNIEWDLSLTHADGDGAKLARKAIEQGADLIVSYGGDGTVKDVVNGLLDYDVPMALLHGGTGNAMAYELGIPSDLEQAVDLIVYDHELRAVDVGQVVCDADPDTIGYFMLRMSMGLQTKILETASRDLKTKYGNLAYVMASLQELRVSETLTYKMIIDGKHVEGNGLTSLIANSAHVGGQANFTFLPTVNSADGLLDVLVIGGSFLGTMDMIGSALKIEGANFEQHWQGKEISVEEPIDQLITLDGEMFGQTPARVKIISNAVKIIVPINGKSEGETD